MKLGNIEEIENKQCKKNYLKKTYNTARFQAIPEKLDHLLQIGLLNLLRENI